MTPMRRIPLAALGLPVVLAACAMPPRGVSDADLAAYASAVASIGCEMRYESDYLPVELQTGLSRAQVVGITEYHLAAGSAEPLPGGGAKLITGACA
ncbi:hypothetical protein [Roseovarius salinarum]|uniref:hypothetical protein n=1 Tax=Roseovarius salinarum TaxID=1981892 RepID=UPI000C32EF40|nr:hypothetical protein [Roseovarius salinarum]